MPLSRRASKIVLTLFAFAGCAALTTSIVRFLYVLSYVATATRAEGVVVKNVYGGGRRPVLHPVVRFEADGRSIEFRGEIGTSPPAYAVNDRVTVLYMPDKPDKALIDSFSEKYLLAIVLAGVGLFFGGLGGGFLWGPRWLARKRQRMIADGVPERARVIDIRVENSYKVNGRSPWYLVAQFRDEITGQTITCQSHYLWEDPHTRHPLGSEVTVYHRQDRPEKCAFQLGEEQGVKNL